MKRSTKYLIVFICLLQVGIAAIGFGLPLLAENSVTANAVQTSLSNFFGVVETGPIVPENIQLDSISENSDAPIDLDAIGVLNGESAQLESTQSEPETAIVSDTSPTEVAEAVEQLDGTAIPTFPPTDTSTPWPTDQPSPTPSNTPIPPTATHTATPLPTLTPTPTLKPLPRSRRLENVSIVPQNFNNCGPSNLSIVLNFHGDDTTQETAASFLKPNKLDRNVSPWQISDYVNANTSMRSTVHSGGTDEILKRLINEGFPVVIEKGYDPPTQDGWYGHYLTVFGYDDDERYWLVQDTNLGPFDGSGRKESYEETEIFWQQFNYTFYVVHSPHDEAKINAILGENLTNELSMWNDVVNKARSQVAIDQGNAYAWYNLGTGLTELGKATGESQYYQDAATVFDEAIRIGLPYRMLWYQHAPYRAYLESGRHEDVVALADATLSTEGGRNVEETYLWKAHALAWLQDFPNSRSAYARALELNKNFYPAQQGLDYIDSIGQ